MKRFLAFLATGAASATMLLALGLSTSAYAQTGGVEAGALILHDALGHTVTIQTPVNPSPAYTAWAAGGFTALSWSVPVPPSTNAQSGFLISGPTTGGPYGDPTVGGQAVLLPYWVSPNTGPGVGIGVNNNGGVAGSYDYATPAQLGMLTSTSGVAFDVSGTQTSTVAGNNLFDVTSAPTGPGVAEGARITSTAFPTGGSDATGLTITATSDGIATTATGLKVSASGGTINRAIDATGAISGSTTITAGTGLTATTGDVTATAGNLAAGSAGTSGTLMLTNTGGFTATLNATALTTPRTFGLPDNSGTLLLTSDLSTYLHVVTGAVDFSGSEIFDVSEIDATNDIITTGGHFITGTDADPLHQGAIVFHGGAAGSTNSGALSLDDGIVYNTSNRQYFLPDATGTLALTSDLPAPISGTTNTMTKFTSATTIGNSALTDDGTTLGYTGNNITQTTVSQPLTIATVANPNGISGAITIATGGVGGGAGSGVSGDITIATGSNGTGAAVGNINITGGTSTSGGIPEPGGSVVITGGGSLGGAGGSLSLNAGAGALSNGTVSISTDPLVTTSTTIGNATGTVGIQSSSWNVSTAGAISGATTISGSGNITTTQGNLVAGSAGFPGTLMLTNTGGFTATLNATALTGPQTFGLPDNTGTLALTSDITTNAVAYGGSNTTLTTGASSLFFVSYGTLTDADALGAVINSDGSTGTNGNANGLSITATAAPTKTAIGLSVNALGGAANIAISANGEIDGTTTITAGTGLSTSTGNITAPQGNLIAGSAGHPADLELANALGFTASLNSTGLSVNRIITLPDGNGTLALRSDITGGAQAAYFASTVGPSLLTATSGAQISSMTGVDLENTATSSTPAIDKVGVRVASTGTWNGAGSTNTGMTFTVNGGTTNTDIKGTSNTWNIASDGTGTFTTASATTINGGTISSSTLRVDEHIVSTGNYILTPLTTDGGIVVIATVPPFGATDIAGTVTLFTGGPGEGTATITFSNPYATAPTVILTPANLAAQYSAAGIAGYYVTSTTNDFTIHVNNAGPVPSAAFNYMVIQHP